MAAKNVIPKSKAKTAYALLSEVRKIILEEPKRYDQNTWSTNILGIDEKFMPACGTVCCVAGWVKTLKRPEDAGDGRIVGEIAAGVLGLDIHQAYALFSWKAAGPRRDLREQTTLRSIRAHAKRGAAHISEFMADHAAQLKAKRV